MNFEDIKHDLINALNNIYKNHDSEVQGKLVLLTGFVHIYFMNESEENLFKAHAMVPSIAIANQKTGQVFHYAVKALLPDLEI